MQAAQFVSASGNDRKRPAGGNNPSNGISTKVPRFGTNSASPAVFPYEKPSWYKLGGLQNSRMGSEKSPSKNTGPLADTNFSIGKPAKDTIGFPTNYTVPYAKILRKFQFPIMDITQLGHLIITKREMKDPILNRKEMEARRYTQLNIVAFNYLQTICEEMPETEDDVISPDELWQKWTIEGIVRSENGQEEAYSRDEVGQERLINSVVKGYTYGFNIWKSDLEPGTKLWLILKKVKTDGVFSLNPQGRDDVRNIPKGNPSKNTNMPYQLIPWAHPSYDYPTDSALIFYDEFGNKRRGKAIYVGRAERGVNIENKGSMKNICTDVSSIVSQPKIFLHVDC